MDAIINHPRSVEVTFDDGNFSDFEFALPVLTAASIKARFFVITNRIGAAGSLSGSNIREMSRTGMVFGTHGVSHRPWPQLAADGELDDELVSSMSVLERLTGSPIDEGAMPRGLYNRAVLTAARKNGLRRVYSVDEGSSRSGSWMCTRYSVIHSDSAESITALLDNPNLTSSSWPLRAVKQAFKRWR